MNRVIPLRSREHIAADKFIEYAQELPCIVEAQIDFHSILWRMDSLVKNPNSQKRFTLTFKTFDSPPGKKKVALPNDFSNITKALIVDRVDTEYPFKRAIGVYGNTLSAMQKLEHEARLSGLADITQVTSAQLDRVVETEAYGSLSTRQLFACELRKICERLADLGVWPTLGAWDHPMSRTEYGKKSSRIQKHPARLSLSEDEAGAIADLFFLAKEPGDVMISSLLALMCCAPCRVSEVTILPAKVEVVQDPAAGLPGGDERFHEDVRFKFGLRWWPAKGGRPQVKFVPEEMVPIAQEALRRINGLTSEARAVAKSIIDTNKMPVPASLFEVLETGEVTSAQVCEIFGINKLTKTMISRLERIDRSVYTLDSVERFWREQIPKNWPVVSDLSKVTYADSLTTHFVNQFNNQHTRPCLVRVLTPDDITKALTLDSNGSNIFERCGVRLPDGSVPKISTHQIRHYLNTIAQRANVPQVHIARWSGRKHLMQNEVYDHTDLEDVVQTILKKGDKAGPGVSVPEIVKDSPYNEDYREALVRQSIHSTPFGFCTSNLRTSPCDRAGACTTCTKLVCIAGHKRHVPAIAADVERRRIAVSNIKVREAQGRRVNPAMKTAMERQLAHTERLLSVVEDPVVRGSFVSNADSPSLVEFSHGQRVFDAYKKHGRLDE